MRADTSSIHRPSRQIVVYWFTRLAPWLTGLAFFVLYTATVAPSLVTLFDDSLEFQLVLPTFAIAHPTGYPLYTLLGGIWSRVLFPFGNWAWRINILSALAAAAAVGLAFAAADRLANGGLAEDEQPTGGLPAGSRWIGMTAGIAAAITFGLGPVWWAQATLAEVYALHNLLLAAVLLVTLTVPGLVGRRFMGRMALLALLFGLGLAHHRTIVLAVPGVAVYLLWSVPGLWRPRATWLLWLAALLLPLLLYLYLPLRAAAGAVDLHGSYANTWNGFWYHVLARGYTSFFSGSALAVERTPQQWFELIVAQVGWVGLMLALVGCGWLFERRMRKGWVLVLLVLAVNFVFTLYYRVGDQEVFLIPVFLCLALLAGGGGARVAALFMRQVGQSEGRQAGLVFNWAGGIAIALLLLLLAWNPGRGPAVNRSGEWRAHDYAVDMAKVPFPPGSTVIGLEGEVTALKYMQVAEGLGTNATPVVADDPQRRREVLARAVASGSPTYLTRELEGIAQDYSFSGDGPLVRVWPRGTAQAGEPQSPLDVPMDDGRLLLKGYDLQWLDWAGGPALRTDLYWQPTAELPRVLKVSLRLLDAAGNPLTNPDGSPAVVDDYPLRQVAPTTTWQPGETVRDVYTLYLPPGAQSQPITVQVILYDAETIAEVGRWETALPAPWLQTACISPVSWQVAFARARCRVE
jgi:hypothetical protein